jgi:GNAT superfamily N-acetyltransferase
MPQLIELSFNDVMPQVLATPLAPALSGDDLRQHRPDRHLMLLDDRGVLQARASCWWTSAPALPEHRVGLIGHYASADESSGVSILREALNLLEFAGCTIAVGPMDGNTWRRYRFISERGGEPPFFLEPDNPDAWREQFERAGFRVMATYTSAVTGDLKQEDPRLDSTAAKLQSEGVTIRAFEPANAEHELKQLYRLSLESFRANYLYSPIDEAEFLDQNRRALPFVAPDLVLMAERDSALVGFVFAVPDVLQQQRRDKIDTIIIKTVAVSPAMANHGLGRLLVGLVQRKARELGFRRAIHALMHEQNVSQNISRRYAHTIRRYALYVRRFPRAIRG